MLVKITEIRRELAVQMSRMRLLDAMVEALEREVNISSNKEYTNQSGPGFDPSQPAPERNKP